MEREEEGSSSSTQHNFFHKWINLQQEDLSELIQYRINITEPESSDSTSRLIIEKNVQHFKEYTEERSQLSQTQASELFAPSWCSSLENSLLWIAGCRPSLYVRLIYALTGLETECQLSQIIGNRDREETRLTLTSGLSPSQFILIDNLHTKTIKEEEKLTSRFTSLQEKIADQPMAMSVIKTSRLCELDIDIVKMLDEHEKSMANMMEEADKLRMNTLKEVIDILTPLQAVEFLATSKKLHLCMHEWGQKRDEMRV